jgi:uncharacterized UPF0160 family protein
LDVGRVYDPERLNFDHHQDMQLQSAAGLIYEHFKDSFCPVEAQPYFAKFIASIDAIDTNRDNIYGVWATLPSGFRHTSAIIGGFNRDVTDAGFQDQQFVLAVDFAKKIIHNEIYSGIKKWASDRNYANRQILENNVAVFDEYNTVWKEKGDHVFVVLPHANGWQIQTVDTTIRKVPESVSDCEGFIFRHGSGFMAVVKDKQVAIDFASTLEPMFPNPGIGD